MDTQDTLRERLEGLKRLNRSRFDFVLERSRVDTNDAALEKIGKTKGWYYKFGEAERKELEGLADELHYEEKIQAEMILAGAVNEAARKKVEGLHSRDKKMQQDAATEILDRVIGKPTQRQELTGRGGGAIDIAVMKPSEIAAAVRSLLAQEENDGNDANCE